MFEILAHPTKGSTMAKLTICLFLAAAVLTHAGVVPADEGADVATLEAELRAAETAFAATMAARDLDAFSSFLADEVVFFTGDTELRGRKAVAEGWSVYFEGPDPLFSWEPEAVAVLVSGGLGFSSGPVFDPEGNRVGTFNSVWRRTAAGEWEIIFDRGCPPCGGD